MSGTFTPAGSVKLATMSDTANPIQTGTGAGSVFVKPDSELTLASLTLSGTATVTGNVTAQFLAGSVKTGITAHAGGGQASATALTAQNNVISVCATAADSVVLPSAAPIGTPVFIRNSGAKDAQVFAVTPGTINAVATGTGVALTAGTSATYRLVATNTWNT